MKILGIIGTEQGVNAVIGCVLHMQAFAPSLRQLDKIINIHIRVCQQGSNGPGLGERIYIASLRIRYGNG